MTREWEENGNKGPVSHFCPGDPRKFVCCNVCIPPQRMSTGLVISSLLCSQCECGERDRETERQTLEMHMEIDTEEQRETKRNTGRGGENGICTSMCLRERERERETD